MANPADIMAPGSAQIIAELAKKATDMDCGAIALGARNEGLPDAIPLLYNRQSGRFENLREMVEAWRSTPERCKGTAKVETLADFIELVSRHKDDSSAIFGRTEIPSPKLTAVIDYSTRDHKPRWHQHRVTYEFPLTEEFKAWVALDGNPLEQGEFATFLEEHAAELAAPLDSEKADYERLFKERFCSPIELIDLSRSLEVNIGAKVKRSERLANGERQVVFETEHTNARGEPIDIPGLFMVALPAWIDGNQIRIPARLRYRIKGGDVVWFYQLYRWKFWLREQVINDLNTAAKETGLPAYLASPEG